MSTRQGARPAARRVRTLSEQSHLLAWAAPILAPRRAAVSPVPAADPQFGPRPVDAGRTVMVTRWGCGEYLATASVVAPAPRRAASVSIAWRPHCPEQLSNAEAEEYVSGLERVVRAVRQRFSVETVLSGFVARL